MFGFAASLTEPAASPARGVCSGKSRRIGNGGPDTRDPRNKDLRVRTASSAVGPEALRQRASLVSKRNFPSGFERKAISIFVWPACVLVQTGPAPIYWTPDGQKLAAMRPVGPLRPHRKVTPGSAGVTHSQEFSCQKNWLSPRPPTNGGSRFLKKVS